MDPRNCPARLRQFVAILWARKCHLLASYRSNWAISWKSKDEIVAAGLHSTPAVAEVFIETHSEPEVHLDLMKAKDLPHANTHPEIAEVPDRLTLGARLWLA